MTQRFWRAGVALLASLPLLAGCSSGTPSALSGATPLVLESSAALTQSATDQALNAPGSTAADFSYLDASEQLCSLHAMESAAKLLLVFFDPDCDHCRNILQLLMRNGELSAALDEGRLTLLAVYADGNIDAWETLKGRFPSNWRVGIDLSGVQSEDRYRFDEMPAFYLLDANKRVLLKNARPEVALARALE